MHAALQNPITRQKSYKSINYVADGEITPDLSFSLASSGYVSDSNLNHQNQVGAKANKVPVNEEDLILFQAPEVNSVLIEKPSTLQATRNRISTLAGSNKVTSIAERRKVKLVSIKATLT